MAVEALRQQSDAKIQAMRQKRISWWLHWRALADYILPRRYRWLVLANQMNRGSPINDNIIDSTGTLAARTLASGMMAGITSPTRPWFKLKIEKYEDDTEVAAWLAECERRLMRVFQESNFYPSLAMMYFDLVVFGSACIIIYQDFENVIHCFNPCAGEYFFELNDKFQIDQVGREFTMTHQQMVTKFGADKVSEEVRLATSQPSRGGEALREKVIWHLIEPNTDNFDVVPSVFKWREIYWDPSSPRDKMFLQTQGFYDWPAMTPRWDVQGNDPYGRSPGMDALGDVKQLQQETRRKAQAIDYMIKPPMIADVQLKNQPASQIPGGWTFVAGLDSNRGARPLYQIEPRIDELRADIAEIQQRTKVTFHNDLFTGITDLNTVRTATEIDARREEKLVLLGPVLERIIGEGLGIGIDRTWGIMERGRLLPPPPANLRGTVHVQVDYVSMLAMAQRGLATAAIEKLWAFGGQLSAVKQGVLMKLDEFETIDVYAEALGVDPRILIATKVAKDQLAKMQEQADAEKAAATAGAAVQGAQVLGDTDVGGGANALQLMLGRENVG